MKKNTNTDLPKFVAIQMADLIKLADAKAIALFSVLGIMTAALLARLTAVRFQVKLTSLDMSLIAYFISGFLIFLALKTVITVIYPRLSKGNVKGMTYFGDIVARSVEKYVEQGLKLTEEETAKNLYRHAYNLARVADAKFKALQFAYLLTGVAISWTIIVLIFL